MFRRTVASAAVALTAAAAVAAIAATSGSAQAPGGRTLSFVEKAKDIKMTLVTHSHHRTPGAGDAVVLALPLYDAGGATRVGMARAVCTIMSKPKRGSEPPLTCEGTFALPDGDVIVVGRLAKGADHLAVVGGTGAYAGARGTFTTTDTKTGATDVLNLLP
jgi:hypothetical protein